MNKSEISKKIASRLLISHRQALRFVKTFEKIIEEALSDEDIISLQGFGSFYVWKQTERLGRNPKTGTPATINARNSVKFKPSPNLLKALNNE